LLEEEVFIPVWELHPSEADLPVTYFKETWAYLVAGQEQTLNHNFPITDLVYFGAEIDSYGKLTDIPNSRNIASFRGRKHFVVACNSRALTHFILKEGSAERKALIHDLLEASRPYDGLQIDFELIPARDGDTFLSFLRELRAGLGNKMFSVALYARTRTLQNDVYDYARIAPIVDRIFVMAYDEHWSTSAPGPVASMDWSQRVARYSLDTIGPEKLIMCMPFYGRSWGNVNGNRAFYHVGVERIIRENNVREIHRVNGIPMFTYEVPLTITMYYDDVYSLSTRMEMYKRMGVQSVGFWRLGQEDPALWSHIGLER
jgi:spore germination protein YaaH